MKQLASILIALLLAATASAEDKAVLIRSAPVRYKTCKEIGCVPLDINNVAVTFTDTGPGCIARENARKIN